MGYSSDIYICVEEELKVELVSLLVKAEILDRTKLVEVNGRLYATIEDIKWYVNDISEFNDIEDFIFESDFHNDKDACLIKIGEDNNVDKIGDPYKMDMYADVKVTMCGVPEKDDSKNILSKMSLT